MNYSSFIKEHHNIITYLYNTTIPSIHKNKISLEDFAQFAYSYSS